MADATALAATMFDVRTSRPLDRSWSVSPFDGRRSGRRRVEGDDAILLLLFVVCCCLLLFAAALITLR